jgi:hypothetical protein
MFSIDEHPMYIYEADGSYIEPQMLKALPSSTVSVTPP